MKYQNLQDNSNAAFVCRWLVAVVFSCAVILYFVYDSTPTVTIPSQRFTDARAPFLDVLQRLDAIDKALKENQQQILFLLRNQRQEKGTNVTEAKSEQKRPLQFRRRPETSHVDCARALRKDDDYLKEIAKKRPVLVGQKPLDMTCSAIRKRVLPPVEMKHISNGVAFARIVNVNYEFVEDQVRAVYHPQNHFCFSLDKKATLEFHKDMKLLADCLPNVYLTPEEFNMDGAGHNQNFAHHECMHILVKKPGWNYLLLLQNHDVLIKSVYELVNIYEWLGGANDVEITPCPGGRYDEKAKYDARSLKFFQNESLATEEQLSGHVHFAKGAIQASFSFEAVDWLINTVELKTLIDNINKMSFGVDEILSQSLQISDELDMPGRFTYECLETKKQNTDFISRMSHWAYGGEEQCATRTIRHAICMLGLEDLKSLSEYPHVMANKMLPDYDYAAVDCVNELLFNRTFLGQVDHPLDQSFYENMVNVRYHKNRKSPDPNYKLECTAKKEAFKVVKYP